MAELRQQNVAANFVLPLIDSANRPQYKTSPTLAAGDVKILRHVGGVYNVANITTLPTEIGSTGMLEISLTATELNPDDRDFPIIIQFVDVTGGEWDNNALEIYVKPVRTNVQEINDGGLSGNNAVLNLSALNIVNTSGLPALKVSSDTASGIDISTAGAVPAVKVDGTAAGTGMSIKGNGIALLVESSASHGAHIKGAGTIGKGLFIETSGTTGNALDIQAANGHAVNITSSGTIGGKGIRINSADGDGIEIVGSQFTGTGHGLSIITGSGTGHGLTIIGQAVGLITRGGTGRDVDATEITAILQDTGTDIPALLAALNNISTAQVKTQIDNALTVDTIAELAQATPSTNPTLVNAIMMLYMIARNTGTQTSTLKKFFNDAGTNVFSQTVSATIAEYSQTKMIPGL